MDGHEYLTVVILQVMVAVVILQVFLSYLVALLTVDEVRLFDSFECMIVDGIYPFEHPMNSHRLIMSDRHSSS